jgi:hypothetical protein
MEWMKDHVTPLGAAAKAFAAVLLWCRRSFVVPPRQLLTAAGKLRS